MVGRTNAGGGGGGSLKKVSGYVSVSYPSNKVITTIDFKPLMILTYAYDNGTNCGVSYRSKTGDAFLNNFYERYGSTWTANRNGHAFDESTGVLTLLPFKCDSDGNWTNPSRSGVRIYYVILGV